MDLHDQLAAARSLQRRIYLADFYGFCRDIMHLDVEEKPHREMCDFLQELVEQQGTTSTQHKGLLLVPRGSFKSTVGTVAISIWLLARNPNARILISSHTWDAAKEWLQEIQTYLQVNEDLREFVGDWKTGSPEWSEHSIIIAKRTKALKESSIDTAGVNKAKTGGHYDFIINDDLHSEKNITTDRTRKSVRRYVQTEYPILEPGGIMLVIGTRWHGADVYGAMLQRDAERVRKGGAKEWRTLIKSCYEDDGSLYFPSRINEEFLAQKREELEPKMFAVWYLNQPMEEGSLIFPKAWWKFFDGDIDAYPFPILQVESEEVKAFPVNVTLAIDPAYSTSSRADYTGITVVATDNPDPKKGKPKAHWWVLEAHRVKAGPVDVLDAVIYFIRKYNIRRLAIETVANQTLYKAALIDHLRKSGLPNVGVYEYKEGNRRTKSDRIGSLQPKLRNGEIHFRRGLVDLFRELEDWPESEHDDLLDSLAQHIAIAAPPGNAWEEILRQEEEDEDDGSTSPKYTLPSAGLSGSRFS
jgi:predicted phage terminase large subunit-like protein